MNKQTYLCLNKAYSQESHIWALLTKSSHKDERSLGVMILGVMITSSDTKSAEANGPLENLMKDKDLLPRKVQVGYNVAYYFRGFGDTPGALPQGL